MASPPFPPPRVEEMKDLPLAIKCSQIYYIMTLLIRGEQYGIHILNKMRYVHIAYVTIMFTPRDIWLTYSFELALDKDILAANLQLIFSYFAYYSGCNFGFQLKKSLVGAIGSACDS